MVRRFVGTVVLLAVLIGGFLLWRRHNDAQELGNGDVHCDGCMTPEEHARFLKENAGETTDGASDHKSKTAREEAATDFQDAAPVNGSSGLSAPRAAGSSTVSAGEQSSDKQQPGFALTNNVNQADGDTLPPDVRNGVRSAGSGPYQWYRQGDLTWRINTATGRSCIIYATLEEWRKPIVISHGCGPHA